MTFKNIQKTKPYGVVIAIYVKGYEMTQMMSTLRDSGNGNK